MRNSGLGADNRKSEGSCFMTAPRTPVVHEALGSSTVSRALGTLPLVVAGYLNDRARIRAIPTDPTELAAC